MKLKLCLYTFIQFGASWDQRKIKHLTTGRIHLIDVKFVQCMMVISILTIFRNDNHDNHTKRFYFIFLHTKDVFFIKRMLVIDYFICYQNALWKYNIDMFQTLFYFKLKVSTIATALHGRSIIVREYLHIKNAGVSMCFIMKPNNDWPS